MKYIKFWVFLVLGVTFHSIPINAQFLESHSIVKSELQAERQEYRCLKTAKAKKTDDGKIYISWMVQGDCEEGSFIIYKSRDFSEPILIDVIYYSGYKLNSNATTVPFYFATIDSSEDNSYNMYHIIKQNKKESLYPSSLGLVSKSAVDFRVENTNSSNKYYMRTPSQTEYYCLEF